ncbi:MAG: shikimate kinase [Eubacteriales bacterium]|nr:shikimate kinase [Eubacteriales bacterium]
MDNIILIGMPGCGKSTAGVILAKTLGMDFVDTDLIICSAQGDKLQSIIEKKGLAYFENVERQVGAGLHAKNCVVATGGSMVLYNEAMENLRSIGKVVYIDVSFSELKRRIKNIKTRGITMGKGESLRDVYEYRKPFYKKYADITVSISSGPIEKTVQKIIERL